MSKRTERMSRSAAERINRKDTVIRQNNAELEELSEKQKYQLVYTRVLLQKPEILLCIQPFRGADLAHRMFIWSMLEKFLDKGISVVILSLNLSDSLAMADRLLILGENGEKREIARENFHKITSPVPWLHMYPSERK